MLGRAGAGGCRGSGPLPPQLGGLPLAATRAGGSGGGRRERGRRRREGTVRPGRRVRPGGRAAAARPGRASGAPFAVRASDEEQAAGDDAPGRRGARPPQPPPPLHRPPPCFVTPLPRPQPENSLQVARELGRGRRGGLVSGTVALCGRIAHGRERPSPEALYPRKLCRTARPRRGRPGKGKAGARKLAWGSC